MGALAKRGLRVQPFKTGPDFIDPTHHTAITGRPSRNLDSWLMSDDVLVELFTRAAEGADLSIIEGVMGLYDGASGTDERGSAAHLSKLLQAPVLLIMDASAMARSAAAIAMGFQKLDEQVLIAGVILNQVGSPRHRRYLEDAIAELTSIRVVGAIPRCESVQIPSRHLGLFSGHESPKIRKAHEQIVSLIEGSLDLESILHIARATEALADGRSRCFSATRSSEAPAPVVAYAWDEAFYFYYRDNLELLQHLGCRLVPFSPLRDTSLPPADLLYLGGGYPELFTKELSANDAVLKAIREFARDGGAIYAECGGLMYLSEGITNSSSQFFPLVGLFPARAVMTQRKLSLGYVEVTFEQDCLLGPRGESIRGHEFHYSQLKATGPLSYVYRLSKGAEGPTRPDGIVVHNVLASYSHLHFASNPRVAAHLVGALRARAGKERRMGVAL
jgi:cobyrinic acid a,c-diamide synthase